jgi:SAM-dependent methyltransferase
MLGVRRKQGGRPSAELFALDGRRLVLHVGCGPPRAENLNERFRGAEWRELRLDIDARQLPDIVGDMIDMRDVIPSESVDAVWSSHNIEHVFTHEVPQVLGEFLRVLRPGGFALITTPDLQRAAERIASGRLEDPLYEAAAGPITPLDMVYGHVRAVADGFHEMAHRTGYTARTLERKLRDAGFVDVRVRREAADRALWADALRPA